MISLCVIILTYNEERHIERAIASVASFAEEVVVVDSFSSDRTTEIATELGARVLQHPFANQSRQLRWALEHTAIASEWIMRLDADEVVEPALAAEISARIPCLPPDTVGINLKRKHIFMGRWIRWGGRYPLIFTRIWRRGHGHVEDRWMDEHVTTSGGRTVTFSAAFADHNLNALTYFIDKHNGYATREAVEILNRRHRLFPQDNIPWRTAPAPTRAKRFAKVYIHDRLPFPLAASCYFVLRYFLQLGFLDGREGLIYHVLQGYWYRFLVGAKVLECERALASCSTIDEKRQSLAQVTGLDL
ncbi:glycosyltransferase family 2 protein [Sinorhizobium sp. BG8]|uniref:glycosyltransferase family 2 protein n=1 Tax=Sinorhizobium sp. BG8 TaxID=2613773 RepID=UPI00193CFC40|nr:glycosyltransferase family 2 protein [Sinorhizobium sp. BG8]QRM56451.1 glycosyltransferase family 2 protein [Sinorhizobium sp. BG8]